MRVRSVLITAVAGVAFLGASASAAHAAPKGPSGLGNTPTTQPPKPQPQPQPKGPGDIAPTPTTQPPKGPGDIAPAPKDDNPGPQGPGDIAPKPKGDDPKPNDDGGNGSGSDYVPPADGSQVDSAAGTDGTVVGAAVEGASVDATADPAPRAAHDGSSVPTFLLIFFALVVAGLIAFLATRFRSEDQDVERV